MDELTRFLNVWEQETQKTVSLLKCLPPDQYDFRPDAGGRSLGELAWHLAEGDAYITHGIERGQFDFGAKPSGIERPRKVEDPPRAGEGDSGPSAESQASKRRSGQAVENA